METYNEVVSKLGDVTDLGVGIVNKVLAAVGDLIGTTAGGVVDLLKLGGG